MPQHYSQMKYHMNKMLLYFVLATQFGVDYEPPIQNHTNA